jgi:hypothetical protein
MGLNITAALLALFVLRPVRSRFIAGTVERAAALPDVRGAMQA